METKRKQLLSVLQNFRAVITETDNKTKKVQVDTELNSKIGKLKERALSILDTVVTEYDTRTQKLLSNRICNPLYQQNLACVLRLLELGIGTLNIRDIQSIVNMYRDDRTAIHAIKSIVSKNNELSGIEYPVDIVETNFNFQEQLRNNIDQYMSGDKYIKELDSLIDNICNMDDDLIIREKI